MVTCKHSNGFDKDDKFMDAFVGQLLLFFWDMYQQTSLHTYKRHMKCTSAVGFRISDDLYLHEKSITNKNPIFNEIPSGSH